MPNKDWLYMLNPHLSIFAIPWLPNTDTELYFNGNIKTLGELMALTDKEILAIKKEKEQAYYVSNCMRREGYDTEQSVFSLTIAEILNISDIRLDQVGRILFYQRDFGSRYHKEQELVHTVRDGRIYHCSQCKYRNPDAKFCGFCMQMLLDGNEIEQRKNNKKGNMNFVKR